MKAELSQTYYGDDRDLLEAIYPTCTSFVRNQPPDSQSLFIEIVFDPINLADSKLFSMLCYGYEDSYEWDVWPLVFRGSSESEIIWHRDGSIVRRSSLEEGVRNFDIYTEEIK